jgi:hypothetical protein
VSSPVDKTKPDTVLYQFKVAMHSDMHLTVKYLRAATFRYGSDSGKDMAIVSIEDLQSLESSVDMLPKLYFHNSRGMLEDAWKVDI